MDGGDLCDNLLNCFDPAELPPWIKLGPGIRLAAVLLDHFLFVGLVGGLGELLKRFHARPPSKVRVPNGWTGWCWLQTARAVT